MAADLTPARKARADLRWRAVAITIGLVLVGGALIQWTPATEIDTPVGVRPVDPHRDPAAHATQLREAEIQLRFEQATVMLHSGQHEYAVAALHRLLALAPQMPEAHVNMGFALIGLKQTAAARDFFATAIELNPMQANAYYGLAMAADELGQRPEAIGAMRSYLHLARSEDPRHLAKARAALWEWEAVPAADAAARR
ncbi:MAG: tetratricopeptide repeat protein [Burkholderiaceae bacterium]|jgi:tetratricopeptide (TPR) repeat protein|nr:tetratricopeptide repeat protein [Burkholderiaceae bacterium]